MTVYGGPPSDPSRWPDDREQSPHDQPPAPGPGYGQAAADPRGLDRRGEQPPGDAWADRRAGRGEEPGTSAWGAEPGTAAWGAEPGAAAWGGDGRGAEPATAAWSGDARPGDTR